MKPVVFDLRGVKFSVESGVLVHVNGDGELSFDEVGIGGLVWPTPIKTKNKVKMLGGFARGDVARDIIPQNLPVGKVVRVQANCDSTIRNAAYRYGMKLKIKPVSNTLFDVEQV